MENKQTVTVIGAGLAGSEAAWQIAQAGYSVRLFEMKLQKFSPAHKSAGFAELICSLPVRIKPPCPQAARSPLTATAFQSSSQKRSQSIRTSKSCTAK